MSCHDPEIFVRLLTSTVVGEKAAWGGDIRDTSSEGSTTSLSPSLATLCVFC
jgi:hypothetical protein